MAKNILEYIDELMDRGMSEEDASRCANVMYNDGAWDDEIPEDEIPELCELDVEDDGDPRYTLQKPPRGTIPLPGCEDIPSWAKDGQDEMTDDEILKAYGFSSAKEFEEYESGDEPTRYW